MKKPLIHDDPIVAVLATWLVGQVEIATGIVFNDEEDEENEKTQTEESTTAYEGGAGMVVQLHGPAQLV